MHWHFIRIGPVCVFLIAALLSSAQSIEGLRHILVIGVDGMSPDGIEQASTPVMDRLIAGGAIPFMPGRYCHQFFS